MVREALKSSKGVVYVLAFDDKNYSEIKPQETIDMMSVIINDERCHIIRADDYKPGAELAAYIKTKLPAGVVIDNVFNNLPAGAEVAKALNAAHVKIDEARQQYPATLAEIRHNPEKYLDHLHPVVAHKLTQNKPGGDKPLFSQIIDASFLEAELPENTREEIKARALANNPDIDPRKLNSVMKWDVSEFARPSLPAILGELQDKAAYSQQKGIRVLDMALRLAGQGWAIPEEFAQFSEAIKLAVEHERSINPDFDSKYNVYITIDQKRVLPGKTQRRAGYHSDAYVTSETTIDNPEEEKTADNTYVIADALPTWYQPGPFPLDGIDPENCDEVLRHFDKLSEGKPPVTFPPHTLIKMTPYDIHTPATNLTDEVITRTFIKIQFSKERYNLIGNTINPNLSYDEWTWVPRDLNIRNHRNSIIGWDRADKDKFTQIYPYSVDFSQDKPDVPWAKAEFIWAKKSENVHVERAVSGEMLFTKHGEDIITINIAQAGDYKITTSKGDQYFLSEAKFKKRYHPDIQPDGSYKPMGTPQKMLVVTQPISIRAPWDAMQYVPAGSVLTSLSMGDTYAIHRDNFQQSYSKIDVSKNEPSSCVTAVGETGICAFCGKCDAIKAKG